MFQTKVALLIKTIYRASHFTLKVRVRSPYISSSLPLSCILIQFVVDTGDVCRKLSHSRRALLEILLFKDDYHTCRIIYTWLPRCWQCQNENKVIIGRWSNGGRMVVENPDF